MGQDSKRAYRYQEILKKIGPALLLVASGCGQSIGRDFDSAKLNQLVKGRTTLEEAIQLLGQPQSFSKAGNGLATLTYSYIHIKAPPQAALGMIPIVGSFTPAPANRPLTKSATLNFDRAGLLQEWTFSESE